MPDIPPGFPPDSEPDPSDPDGNRWYEDPAGPDPPDGPPDDPDAGVDPDKSNPNSPNYEPTYDPKVSEPELPVPPGTGVWPDDYVVDHSADPNWVSEADSYPDNEAPADPSIIQSHLTEWQLFQTIIYLNGTASYPIGSDSLDSLRAIVKAFLLMLTFSQPAPFVQIRTLDVANQVYVDLSGGTPPDGWDGMVNVEVRVQAGFGGPL